MMALSRYTLETDHAHSAICKECRSFLLLSLTNAYSDTAAKVAALDDAVAFQDDVNFNTGTGFSLLKGDCMSFSGVAIHRVGVPGEHGGTAPEART